MSVSTKTGDAGTTALMYGRRVPKTDARIAAVGGIDELNATLGLARASVDDPWVRERVRSIQKDLITLMGELATHPDDLGRLAKDGFGCVTDAMVQSLDSWLTELEAQSHSYSGWATPGENLGSAALDVARTVCRRAERSVCALVKEGSMDNHLMFVYLNRLSDLLWLMARRVEGGGDE